MSDKNEDKNISPGTRPFEIEGHREELVDHYWGSINYVFSLIKASEIKAGLILSFYGILMNLIYSNLGTVIKTASEDHLPLYIPLSLWAFFTVASIFFSIKCFMPRMETKYKKNVFFFKDIISQYGNIREFARTFYEISLDEVELFDQLGQQIYVNSKIADLKFRSVNRSIHFLAISLLMLLITGLWYLIITL